MSHNQLTNHVRQIVYETFRQNGASVEDVPEETILVRSGIYCGRRFDAAGLHAVWFLEENQVKFYGPGGLLCQVMHPATASLQNEQRVA